MKNTHRCPKCQHDRILYIATVTDHFGDSGGTVPMRIAHFVHPKSAGTQQHTRARSRTEQGGELEAGVCPRCGYTELYVKGPADIVVDGTNVRELVAASPPPPKG